MDATDFLESAGLVVVEARNADEAILILEQRDDIHLIFTDINMPGSMDGLKLAHFVRGRWPPIELLRRRAMQKLMRTICPTAVALFPNRIRGQKSPK